MYTVVNQSNCFKNQDHWVYIINIEYDQIAFNWYIDVAVNFWFQLILQFN